MAFLLRSGLASAFGGGGGLGSVFGSIGKVAKGAVSGLTHAVSGVGNLFGCIFGGIGGAARSAANVVAGPFKLLSSPIFMLGVVAIGGLLVVTLIRR